MSAYPKVGDTVTCPPDCGAASYTGKVVHVATQLQTHACVAKPFLWVTVQHSPHNNAVWPSYRLGYVLPEHAS